MTARAYEEFAPPGDEEWARYLAEIADVAGRADRTLLLGAFEGPRVVGTATLEVDQTIGDDDQELPRGVVSLRMLGVDPGRRGTGVGRALVEACLQRARAAGKTAMVLRTTERMAVAQALYRSLGFVRDPGRDMVFDSGFRLIAYRLKL